jgi:hypothetical protein
VDTGAALSLFPLEVWKTAAFESIGEVRVGGVVPRNECRIAAQLALVECALSDGTAKIRPLRIHAYLARSNEVPTLIGMADLIERGVLHADIAAGHVYSDISG